MMAVRARTSVGFPHLRLYRLSPCRLPPIFRSGYMSASISCRWAVLLVFVPPGMANEGNGLKRRRLEDAAADVAGCGGEGPSSVLSFWIACLVHVVFFLRYPLRIAPLAYSNHCVCPRSDFVLLSASLEGVM